MMPQPRERMENWIREHCGPQLNEKPEERGVSLREIGENLELSPEQRLRKAERRRRDVESIQRYARKIREKIQKTAPYLLPAIDHLGLRMALRLEYQRQLIMK